LIDENVLERPTRQNLREQDIVQISKLVKKYTDNVAVNQLSLTMYRDECLVLLGHNGAGKTTTISCMTGMEKPTSGTATAFGKDLLGDF